MSRTPPPATHVHRQPNRRLVLAIVALSIALAASLTVGTVAYLQGRADTEAIIELIGGRSALRDLENNNLRQQIDAAVCDALLPWPADDPTAAEVRAERNCPDPTTATPAPPAAESASPTTAPSAADTAPAPAPTAAPQAAPPSGGGPDPPTITTQPPSASTPPAEPTPGPDTPDDPPPPAQGDDGLLCQLIPIGLVCAL